MNFFGRSLVLLFAKSKHFVSISVKLFVVLAYAVDMTRRQTKSISETKYREMLESELRRRRSKNAGYSLRAFAKQIGVSVTTLSQVLNGKRTLSRSSAMQIAESLFTDISEQRRFLLSALGVQSFDEVKSSRGGAKIIERCYTILDADQFKLIAEWYHFAILSLAKVQPNVLTAEWIAGRLGIQKRQSKGAIDRLLRLGLIVRDGSGFIEGSEPLFVRPAVPSFAVRQYHQENLERANIALNSIPQELRDITSITMATSPQKIVGAREMIQKFREDMSEYLEEGELSEVYTLAVQLFPVTKIEVIS